MIDGTRTRDNLNHNQGLYQLSYDHRLRGAECAPPGPATQAEKSPQVPWRASQSVTRCFFRITRETTG